MKQHEIESKNDSCICKMMGSAGAMAPRLWECPSCGKTGMIFPMQLVDAVYDLSPYVNKDDAWYAVKGLSEIKRIQALQKDEIYYSEDHLIDDAMEVFGLEREGEEELSWWQKLKRLIQ